MVASINNVSGSHDYATTNQNALPWMLRLCLTSRETRLNQDYHPSYHHHMKKIPNENILRVISLIHIYKPRSGNEHGTFQSIGACDNH
jgi:hypothetical protein